MHLGFALAPDLGFDDILQQVKGAEAAGFDFVWLAERMAGGEPRHDATLLASALATQTHDIGLLVTAAPARHEPYNLARRMASLDWISNGRIGWMVDAGTDHDREHEYIGLVGNLWDSWDDDAFIYDKAASRFFTPDKMHVLNHAGPHFSVRGPLNVNRPPQGRPIIAAMAGAAIAEAAELVLMPDGASRAAGSHARSLGLWSDFRDVSASLADLLERERDRLGLDGFVLVPSSPAEIQSFVGQVMPELARRGLVTGNQAGSTLRDRLGLTRPALPAKNEVSA